MTITVTIMQSRRILVTGAGGQLGRELRALASAHPEHEFIFSDIAAGGPDGRTEVLDICDAAAVLSAVRSFETDTIVNCAAYTNVDGAEDDEETADRVNRLAVRNLAAAAKETGAFLVHVSTDYVFQGNACTPYRETDTPSPASAYGRTKLAGEQEITASGCRHVILRTAWLYSHYGKNFVKTMQRLTGEKECLRVVYDQVGSPTYAGDLARAILTILADPDVDSKQGIYHYTGEGVCSWYDFAVTINALCGHHCDISPCRSEEWPSKVQRPHYSVLDKSRIKTAFGLRIPHWMDSLTRMLSEQKTIQ